MEAEIDAEMEEQAEGHMTAAPLAVQLWKTPIRRDFSTKIVAGVAAGVCVSQAVSHVAVPLF